MHDIGGNRGAGHAEDDRTGLVLGDNVPAEFMQRKQAIETPSRPMPVRTTPIASDRYTLATDWNRWLADGLNPSIDGHADIRRARSTQPVGKAIDKSRRDVLHHENGQREVARQFR